jgi:hypothetical protein
VIAVLTPSGKRVPWGILVLGEVLFWASYLLHPLFGATVVTAGFAVSAVLHLVFAVLVLRKGNP